MHLQYSLNLQKSFYHQRHSVLTCHPKNIVITASVSPFFFLYSSCHVRFLVVGLVPSYVPGSSGYLSHNSRAHWGEPADLPGAQLSSAGEPSARGTVAPHTSEAALTHGGSNTPSSARDSSSWVPAASPGGKFHQKGKHEQHAGAYTVNPRTQEAEEGEWSWTQGQLGLQCSKKQQKSTVFCLFVFFLNSCNTWMEKFEEHSGSSPEIPALGSLRQEDHRRG